MNLNKLSKPKLLVKCDELGLQKCKSKNKRELIESINTDERKRSWNYLCTFFKKVVSKLLNLIL